MTTETPAINFDAFEARLAAVERANSNLASENDKLAKALDTTNGEFDTFKDAAENRISQLERDREEIGTQLSALSDALENFSGDDDETVHLRAWTRKVLENYYHDDRPARVVAVD